MMTEKDRALVARARTMHYTEWTTVAMMEDEAESEEAKEILRQIAINGNHREEASVGLI